MNKKKLKLSLRKLTIQNLDLKQLSVLVTDEVKVVKGGKEDTSVLAGVFDHPKYCL